MPARASAAGIVHRPILLDMIPRDAALHRILAAKQQMCCSNFVRRNKS